MLQYNQFLSCLFLISLHALPDSNAPNERILTQETTIKSITNVSENIERNLLLLKTFIRTLDYYVTTVVC